MITIGMLNVFNTCMMASLDYMDLGDRITPHFTATSTIGMNRILRDKMFHHIVGTKNNA